MARLPYLEADQVAPEYRDMLKRNTNLHKLLVNSPEMARAFNGIGGYIRFKSKLDPRLRELAILQVGWLEKSEYEFTHHVKIGKEFGVTDADIAALMAETEGKPSGLEPLAKAVLKGGRWLLVKNAEHLTAEEGEKLAHMLAVSPELNTCYDLKESFRTWFEHSPDRKTADSALLDWQAKAKATGLRSLQAFVNTLNNWREGLLNYFNGRHSNGFAEGVNLKIKMLNRRGFGYRNFAHFRLHILVEFEPGSR